MGKKYNTSEFTIRRFVIPPNDVHNHPDFPRKSKNTTEKEYDKKVEKYYEKHDLKQMKDFSEDEKNAVIEDGTLKLMGPKKLSEKYKSSIWVVKNIIQKAGFPSTPDELSRFPDFPVRTQSMSDGDFQETVKKYWKNKKHLQKQEKTETTKNKNIRRQEIRDR